MLNRNPLISRVFSLFGLCVALLALTPSVWAATRTLEFTTTEVTQAQLSVSAEGDYLIFNLLGHLHSVPVTGGTARQLTFGSHYDSAPVFSPDGKRVAFVSSRDDSDGNVYVMDVSGGNIKKLSDDFLATFPVWSPDGKTIAYVSGISREDYPPGQIPGFGFNRSPVLSRIATVPARGGDHQYQSDLIPLKSVFYLADGRLGWTQTSGDDTAVKAMDAKGDVSDLGMLPGSVDRVTQLPDYSGFYYLADNKVQRFNFSNGQSTAVADFDGGNVFLAVSADNKTIYASAQAELWRLDLASGQRRQLPFSAKVEMETTVPAKAHWQAPSADNVKLRAIMTPRLSPDGQSIVFMAAGSLWQQKLDGSQAKKLINEVGYQIEPAFSPDGKELAFVSDRHGKREVRVLTLDNGRIRSVASVPSASWALFPSWSPDGSRIAYQRSDALFAPYSFISVNAADGSDATQLAQTFGNWNGRPHLSQDGAALYYTARNGHYSALYRLPLAGGEVKALTDLTRHVHDGLVSPDGKWLALRRNSEIWLAASGEQVLTDKDFKLFSDRGGRSFAFSPDSSEIVYSEGGSIWRKPVAGGRAKQVELRLELPRQVADPVLISNVRVLDLVAGKFTEPTTMLLQNGRIVWVGPRAGRALPANTRELDAKGRYAMPGIMDSHTHAAWANHQVTDESLIAYGVTSVRDTGSRLDIVNAQLDRAYATNEAVPRYFAAGDIFEGMMPLWGDAFLEITSEQEARDYVRLWKEQGVNFVKIYDSLPWYLREVVAQEANKLGLPIAGHGLSVEQTVRSVNLGFTSVEHNNNNTNDDIIKLLVHSGLRLDPTLTIFGQGTNSIMADEANLDKKLYAYIPEDDIKAANPGRPLNQGQFEDWKKNTLGAIHEKYVSGVKMLDGTDARMGGVFHGPSVHWSLQFFAWAGLPPIEVLRMGTIDAAEVVGAANELGSLDPGKIADIMLLDANPLEDVANTLKIWRVFRDGHEFDPETMQD